MFENTNKEMPFEIAKETMKAHRLRNIMACLAIALTTVLITVICGAGISTVDALLAESDIKPGPGTNGLGIYGDMDTLDKVRKESQVEWADIARPCMQGTPRNKEFAGNEVKFLAVNQEYYGHHYVNLISGNYPKNEGEVLISDTLVKKAGTAITPGQKITLNLIVLQGGKQVELPVDMTISGIYDNPLEMLANYEELYTVETFPDTYNPELNDALSIIYIKFLNVTKFTPEYELNEKIGDICDRVDGKGVVMAISGDISTEIMSSALLLLLVMICGFLLIYNIFYISVVNDIRFIGNMKIIGMTKKQIGMMLNWQIRRLGAAGIILGDLAGTGLNLFVIRLFKMQGFSYSQFYKTETPLFLAAVFSIIFSAITVWISSKKAISLAKKVSPIEASRFRSSGKKKTVFAIFSFTLGGILFCMLFTVFVGYDTEWKVDRKNESDFTIQQWHAIQPMNEAYEPMSDKLVNAIRNLDFVKESYLFYYARNTKDEEASDGFYDQSIGEVKFEGRIKEVMKEEFKKLQWIEEEYIKNGRYKSGILGMDAEALDMEVQNINILDGKLDAKLFASGDYLIYHPFSSMGKKDYLDYGMRAGEKITLSFWDYTQKEYRTKTFTVMAVVEKIEDNYAGEISLPIQFVISNHAFEEIYKESAKKMVGALHLNTLGRNQRMEQSTIEKMIENDFNPQVQMHSRYQSSMDEQSKREQGVYIGLVMGLIVAFIGLTNIINTMVTDVLSRKIEFATMQSIGMTKYQMIAKICGTGIKMVLISLLLISPLSLPAAKALASIMTTGFRPPVFAQSCILTLFAGILVVYLTSCILTITLNQKTAVERLREAE